MLKIGDSVYRINLEAKTVDKLKVEQISNYGDSFEFDLRSKDPNCRSNGSYKYYKHDQASAEEEMRELSLVFPYSSNVTSFIFKKEMALRKELETYQTIKASAIDLY